MIGHQTIGPDIGRIGAQIKVEHIIAPLKEGAFAPVAMLGCMVGDAEEN
jgi:hypothetical protein